MSKEIKNNEITIQDQKNQLRRVFKWWSDSECLHEQEIDADDTEVAIKGAKAFCEYACDMFHVTTN